MAAPHAAGAAAVLLAQNPALTPAQVAGTLTANATAGVISGSSTGTPNRLLYAAAVQAAPAAPVASAPSVTAAAPAAKATAVAVGVNVTATFSTAVQGVGSSTFLLKNAAGKAIPATVAYNATTRKATLDPASNLVADTVYTATLVGGAAAIRDSAGTPLVTMSWTFLTGPAPVVTRFTPGSNALLVKRGSNVTVTFSEAVQGVGTGTFTVKNASTGALVSARVFRNGTTHQWILDPSLTLAKKTKYTVTVSGGTTRVRDLAGNVLASKTWQFTTGSF
jgi:hypothetical protein